MGPPRPWWLPNTRMAGSCLCFCDFCAICATCQCTSDVLPKQKKKWCTSNGPFPMTRMSWDSPLGYVKGLCFKMLLWCFDLFLESVWSIYIEHGRPAPGRRQNELRRTRGVPLAPTTPTQRHLHQTEVRANRFGNVGCITGSWTPAPLHFPCALLVGYQQPAPRHHHDTDLAVSSHAARGTTPHPPAVGSPRSSHHAHNHDHDHRPPPASSPRSNQSPRRRPIDTADTQHARHGRRHNCDGRHPARAARTHKHATGYPRPLRLSQGSARARAIGGGRETSAKTDMARGETSHDAVGADRHRFGGQWQWETNCSHGSTAGAVPVPPCAAKPPSRFRLTSNAEIRLHPRVCRNPARERQMASRGRQGRVATSRRGAPTRTRRAPVQLTELIRSGHMGARGRSVS